jgi:uncharacterized membrane protein YgdD (TMEM256/DUF423 family)
MATSAEQRRLSALRRAAKRSRPITAGSPPVRAQDGGELAEEADAQQPVGALHNDDPRPNRWRRIGFGAAGLNGMAGVAAGAMVTHGGLVNPALVETASRYQMLHAVALVAISLAPGTFSPRVLALAGALWVLGCVFFCLPLYFRAAGVADAVWHLTPVGGMAFILGWLTVFLAAMMASRG